MIYNLQNRNFIMYFHKSILIYLSIHHIIIFSDEQYSKGSFFESRMGKGKYSGQIFVVLLRFLLDSNVKEVP
jgi:hypothetical protein